MKTKKIVAGAVTLFAAVTLAACSNAADKDIISMKGSTITVSEFYDQVKTNTSAQQVLVQMIINDVFEAKYGKKVTEKEVNKAYEDMAKQYGDSFESALASAGMTAKSYKAQIRTNKLVEYAIAEAAKKELTDENYKAAYDAYTPEVTARVIKLDDEANATEILAKAQAGEEFANLAKENSTDEATKENGGEIKFDSTSTTVATELKTAIFALESGQVGAAVVPVMDTTTYETAYYVVKLEAKSEKASDWKEYKKVLKESILSSKKNDQTFVTNVISSALKEANVKVKDEAFQNVLSQYLPAESTSSSEKAE